MRIPVSSKAYCVYTHQINDQVFYVGMGLSARIFTTTQRNRIWNDLVAKNNFLFDVVVERWFANKDDARTYEGEMICDLKPKANIVVPEIHNKKYKPQEIVLPRITQ